MRKQVGWYNPKSGGLCMKHDKVPSTAYEMYTVPVFADDTVPMFADAEEPVLECEKSRDENDEDDRLMNEIRVQTLENQVAMLLMMLQSRGEVIVEIETRRNLTSMRKQSVELLERLKKNEQARSD